MCVTIDVTKPLPGSLTIARGDCSLRVPLIYEGLQEVCPLCGGDLHQLDSCPRLPLNKKIEVIVEKFDAHNMGGLSNPLKPSSSFVPITMETWVTVTPKKRFRSSFGCCGPATLSKPTPVGPSVILGKLDQGSNPGGDREAPARPHQLPSDSIIPVSHLGITLANPKATSNPLDPLINIDPLRVCFFQW